MQSITSEICGMRERIGSAYTNVCRKTVIALSTGVIAGHSYGADITLGDVGNNAGDNASGLTNGALLLAGFVGVVMVIIAFVKGRSARQQGEGIGGAVGLGLLGALLLAVPTIISIVNNSLLGSDASSTMQGQIIAP